MPRWPREAGCAAPAQASYCDDRRSTNSEAREPCAARSRTRLFSSESVIRCAVCSWRRSDPPSARDRLSKRLAPASQAIGTAVAADQFALHAERCRLQRDKINVPESGAVNSFAKHNCYSPSPSNNTCSESKQQRGREKVSAEVPPVEKGSQIAAGLRETCKNLQLIPINTAQKACHLRISG
jgi:hypothetical protein